MKNVYISDLPLLKERIGILRNKETETAVFRKTVLECGELLSIDISHDLPTIEATIQTPLEETKSLQLKHPITVVAILRAALGMVEGLLRYLPQAKVGHIGIYRNEETLQPVKYFYKMPKDIGLGPVILADPMLATGGSLITTISELVNDISLDSLRIATLIATPEGIEAVHKVYPTVPIYTASVDRQLNENGYILPGLGDAGDRQYGTL